MPTRPTLLPVERQYGLMSWPQIALACRLMTSRIRLPALDSAVLMAKAGEKRLRESVDETFDVSVLPSPEKCDQHDVIASHVMHITSLF